MNLFIKYKLAEIRRLLFFTEFYLYWHNNWNKKWNRMINIMNWYFDNIYLGNSFILNEYKIIINYKLKTYFCIK